MMDMDEDVPVVLGILDQLVEATVLSEDAVKKIPVRKKYARKISSHFNLKIKKCSVGVILQEPCHKKHSIRRGIIKCTTLSQENRLLLRNRTGIEVTRNMTICYHHRSEFIGGFFKSKSTSGSKPVRPNPNKRIVNNKNMHVVCVSKQETFLNGLGLSSACGSALSSKKPEATIQETLEHDKSIPDLSEIQGKTPKKTVSSKKAVKKITESKNSGRESCSPFNLVTKKCCFGRILHKRCHVMKYSRIKGIIKCTAFSQEDQFLLHNRTGIEVTAATTVCYHHKSEFLGWVFETKHTFCCNPLGRHPNIRIMDNLFVISIRTQKIVLNELGLALTCGKKLCFHCLLALSSKIPGGTLLETVEHDEATPSGSEIQEGNC